MLGLIKLLGPEAAAELARPLTPDEDRLVLEALQKHGSASAALGLTDPELSAEVDRLVHR
jgi:hypothetical protein